MEEYIGEALDGFIADPADSAFQKGYLSALLNVAKELGYQHPRLLDLEAQVRA